MKKLLLILLLIPVTSFAQWPLDPMADSLIQEAYQQIGIPTTGTNLITSTRSFSALNRALGQVCVELPAYEKVTTLVVKVDSVLGTSLPSDCHRVKDAFRVFGDSLRIPLMPIDPDSLRQHYGSVEADMESTSDLYEPGHYFTYGGRFYFHPKYRSSTADTVLLHYYGIDTISTGTNRCP